MILDNLNTHLGAKVRHAIEAQGCQLLFLPSYSPDLSPIEEAFSPPQSRVTPGGSTDPGSLTRGDRASSSHDHEARCSGLVYALRLSPKTNRQPAWEGLSTGPRHACERATTGTGLNWGGLSPGRTLPMQGQVRRQPGRGPDPPVCGTAHEEWPGSVCAPSQT